MKFVAKLGGSQMTTDVSEGLQLLVLGILDLDSTVVKKRKRENFHIRHIHVSAEVRGPLDESLIGLRDAVERNGVEGRHHLGKQVTKKG